MAKYKRAKDGRFHKYLRSNRKLVHISSTDEKEFEKLVLEAEYQRNKGATITNDNITFEELAEKWYNLTKKNLEFNTTDTIKRTLKLHIYPELGPIPVKLLKTYHIQELINQKIEDGYTDTIRKMTEYIKSILNFGVVNDFLIKNVAISIKIPKFKSKEKQILTTFQRNVIEEVAKKNKHGDMIMVFLYTGLRREELLPLTKKDISDGFINVNKAIYFESNQAHLKTTKNTETRIIPIFDKISKILDSRCKQKNSIYLFPMTNGKIKSQTSFREAMKNFENDCNKYIDNLNKELNETNPNEEKEPYEYFHFTAHVLRHTFCTFLYYSGVGIKEAQEIMGHKSARMTMDLYAHLDQEKKQETTNKINKYLSNLK